MLIDVLERVAADTGYGIVDQRVPLIKLLNVSAKEIYDALECNRVYREATFVVPPNKLVSLPPHTGSLRGMRKHTNETTFDLHSMSSPRYVTDTLGYKRDNWRDVGMSAVHTYVASIGKLTIEAQSIDGVTLLIAGSTAIAARVEEQLVVSASPIQTAVSFGPEIHSISCRAARTCNIIIKDTEGNEIAVLYNNRNNTSYRIVDVSELHWSLDTVAGESLIDVLYKNPLGYLDKDTDEFPAGNDYDEAWYHMCMHKFYVPVENRQDDASMHRAACFAALVEIKGGNEDQQMKKISFGRNKFFDLFTGWCYPESYRR